MKMLRQGAGLFGMRQKALLGSTLKGSTPRVDQSRGARKQRSIGISQQWGAVVFGKEKDQDHRAWDSSNSTTERGSSQQSALEMMVTRGSQRRKGGSSPGAVLCSGVPCLPAQPVAGR